jgi:uncharacterized protein with HEPN domain
MMRDARLYLQDIVDSIEKIQKYTDNMTSGEFEVNDMVVDAVARNFEIIGEAAAHVSDYIKEMYPDVPWYKMRGMRNIMVHEYFGVDLDIVWDTARKSLPLVAEKIKKIIIEGRYK